MSRLENFEGHARSGDVRAARFETADIPWLPSQMTTAPSTKDSP